MEFLLDQPATSSLFNNENPLPLAVIGDDHIPIYSSSMRLRQHFLGVCTVLMHAYYVQMMFIEFDSYIKAHFEHFLGLELCSYTSTGLTHFGIPNMSMFESLGPGSFTRNYRISDFLIAFGAI